jgi:WD40 repeat protein
MLDTAHEETAFHPSWPPTPYTGLRPFQLTPGSDESLIFHGRDADKDEILKRLSSSHMVFVVGPSGCGKSSLVKAGVIPALEAGLLSKAGHDWHCAEMRPQQRPLRYLARALATLYPDNDKALAAQIYKALLGDKNALWLVAENLSPRESQGAPLLLLIDQFEEVFGPQITSQDEVKCFLECVIRFFEKPHPNLYCIATMRTDFLDRCANFPQLADVINETMFVTPVLRAQELGTVIALPPEDYHARVEAKLVKRIVSDMTVDVQYDPDRLPLMQHAALWLWNRAVADAGLRHGPRPEQPASASAVELKAEDYEAFGGLKGILNKHAEELFDSLGGRGKEVAEVLFRRVSERDADNCYRRAPASAKTICALAKCRKDELDRVVAVFAASEVAFLSSRPMADNEDELLDVSHEALIRQWDRLHKWADDEADKVGRFRELARSAARWDAQGRSKDFFKARNELYYWQTWWDLHQPSGEWIERYHLHRIGGKPLPELFELTEEYLRENREHVRTQSALIVAGIAAGVLLAWMGSVAVGSYLHDQTVLHLQQGKARVLAAQGEEAFDRDGATKALLIGVAGLNARTYVPELERLTYKALQHLREWRVFSSESGFATNSFSPDGKTLLVADARGEVKFWNVQDSRLLGATAVPGFPAFIRPKWSDNGAWVVGGSGDGRTVLFAPCSREELRPLFMSCQTETRDLTRALKAGHISWPSVLSPNGTQLLTGGFGTPAKLWDLRSEEPEYRTIQTEGAGFALAFHPKGRLAAVGAPDGSVRVYDTENVWADAPAYTLDPRQKLVASSCSTAGAPQRTAPSAVPVTSITFHPTDAEVLAASSVDGTVRVWNFTTGQISCQKKIQFAGFATATFSASGKLIAVTSEDGPVVWNLETDELVTLRGHRRSTWMVDFGATDDALASSSSETTRVWRMQPVLQATPLGDQGLEVPLGGVKATGGTLRIRNIPQDKTIDFPLPAHSSAAVSPDGAHVVTAQGSEIRLYDSAVGPEPIAVLQGPDVEWKKVGFLAAPDRVVAIAPSGAAFSWRYFKERAALISFALDQLPREDGIRADLPAKEQCRLGIKIATAPECLPTFAQGGINPPL